MEQGDLIFFYHFLVMAIILATAIVALGGILQVGIFKSVSDSNKKILVGALIVQLAGAFIGVYNTLPTLKFKIAEKFSMDIEYGDLITNYSSTLREYQKICFDSFAEPNKLASYFRCEDNVTTYNVLSKLATKGNGYKSALEEWQSYLNEEENACIDSYKKLSNAFPECKGVLGKYYRYSQASNGVGKGDVYVSVDNGHYVGVVNYSFPNENQPIILDVSGEKIASNYLFLRFDQKSSAIEFKSKYIPRDPASFYVCVRGAGDSYYKGKLIKLGEKFECSKDDLDAFNSIADITLREIK